MYIDAAYTRLWKQFVSKTVSEFLGLFTDSKLFIDRILRSEDRGNSVFQF